MWEQIEHLFVPIAALPLGFGLGWLAGYYRRRAKPEEPVEFEKRPIEPERDGQRATRDPNKPKRHARVTTAHMSQRRKSWN